MEKNIERENEYLEKKPIEYFPGDDKFEEVILAMGAAVSKARPLSEVLFDRNSTNKEIFCSSYREVMMNNKELKATDVDKIEPIVIQQLYKNGMDYNDIIMCMSYSLEFKNLNNEQRWTMAAYKTFDNLSPMLAMPEIKEARSVYQLRNASGEQMYYSYLKHVYEQNPDFSLMQAESAVYTKLVMAKIDEETVQDILKASYYFKDKSLIEVNNIVNGKTKIDEISNEALYLRMNKKINTLKFIREDGNSEVFWKEVHSVLRQTLFKLNEETTTLKAIRVWARSMTAMSHDFNIDVPAELQKEINNVEEMYKRIGETEVKFEKLYDIGCKLDNYFIEILKIPEHPALYSYDEVKKAPYFKEINLAGMSAKKQYADIYYSALKTTLRENPHCDLEMADLLVIKTLKNRGWQNKPIIECLKNSVRYNGSTEYFRMKEATGFVNSFENLYNHKKSRAKVRG